MSHNISQLKRIIEAAIFVAEDPLSPEKISQLFSEEERPSIKEIKEIVAEISKDYQGRGVVLKEVASGYRFQAQEDLASWVNRLWAERPPRYSRAFLETLALIAYRQPITRAEIEDVRGVAVNPNSIKTMIERNWIKILGTRDVPGKPALFGTTKEFLDYFNLKSLSELPALMQLQDIEKLGEQLPVQLQIEAVDEDTAVTPEEQADPEPIESENE